MSPLGRPKGEYRSAKHEATPVNEMHCPRLLISAAHKSSGKTTLAVGLARALAERGLVVQTFKKGPDYIDPMWLARASGRPCFNLDPHLMHDAEIGTLFARHAHSADVSLVEGNKGLYDGLALDGSDSNAALARRLDMPVLLVIDARGMTRGIAPLILGYQAFDRQVRIGGVILNQLGGARHEAKLRAVIEHYTDVPVLGAVQHDSRLAVVERHLGLMPTAEVGDAAERLRGIADAVASQVDLERVRALAASACSFVCAPPLARPATPIAAHLLRIGIARDEAFGFYYPDDLEALEAAGATLVPIDMLRDSRLPLLDGLFIGGGFPEAFMAPLEANAALRNAIRAAIAGGLPTYAECGGLMVLARSITWNGKVAQMVGAIPGDIVMRERPVGRGYVSLAQTHHHPWPIATDSGTAGAACLGHEFHHSELVNADPGLRYAYAVQRGHGVDGRRDGVLVNNLLASYSHLRATGGNQWPQRFVNFVRSRCQPQHSPAAAVAAVRELRTA